MIPADVTVAARRMDDAGRLSCVLRSHPARAHLSAPACTLSSAVQRATVNLQPLSPLAAAAAPGTGAAALRPTLPLASPLAAAAAPGTGAAALRPYIAPRLVPLAAAAAPGTGAAALRPYTLSSAVQRATVNLQPLSPLLVPCHLFFPSGCVFSTCSHENESV
ncbi:hypothetical protein RoseRS_0551 [Roseiflexus sp. RS-1]|jgi:hypothetical protein|nr:hypothetical protein RoseRS_0551 [Roseiflexus sp. RS-1]